MEDTTLARGLLGATYSSAPFGLGLLAQAIEPLARGLLSGPSFASRMDQSNQDYLNRAGPVNSTDDARRALAATQVAPSDPRSELAMALTTTTPGQGISSLLFDREARQAIRSQLRGDGAVYYGGGFGSDYYVLPSGHVVRLGDHSSPNARSAADLYIANSPGSATVQNVMTAVGQDNIIGRLTSANIDELLALLNRGANAAPPRFADASGRLAQIAPQFPASTPIGLGFDGRAFRQMPTPQLSALINRTFPYGGMPNDAMTGATAELLARQGMMNWRR